MSWRQQFPVQNFWGTFWLNLQWKAICQATLQHIAKDCNLNILHFLICFEMVKKL
jgi:hypothetical protein